MSRHEDDDAGAGLGSTLTLRWREPRVARGRPRLAQRVRADVPIGSVRAVIEGVARGAHADEFEVVWPDGSASIHHRDVLLGWAEGGRVDLPTVPSSEWDRDQSTVIARAAAIDRFRDAVRGLLACGLVDGDWADDVVRRLHVSLQSLPVSSVPLWRF